MTEQEKKQSVVNIIRHHLKMYQNDLINTKAQLAAEQVRFDMSKKYEDDNFSGFGRNPHEQNLERYIEQSKKAEKGCQEWTEVYEYAVDTFLKK